jgi:predicted PurR-regulated permease PerM
MKIPSVNKLVLLGVLFVISIIFLGMIQPFLIAILLAGIFSAMVQPIYKKFKSWFHDRKGLASLFTLLLICLLFFLPLLGLMGIVAGQAIRVSNSIKPWIEKNMDAPHQVDQWLNSLPFYDKISAYNDVIIQKAGELVGKLSNFLLESLSSVTLSTVNFIFLFFIFLYTMYFFIKEGDLLLKKILYYLPLNDKDEQRILERFTSVTRATIKGTILIGVIQGGLAGVAFWVVGINSAVFWGTIMTVLSVIPAVGSSLVWFPVVIVLLIQGQVAKAIGLFIFCGLLVGSVDNILRPRFVGKDTKMHELLIFFGILGGISFFGIIGFIIGPIVAALFVTIWDIYGETFKEYLPEVKMISSE